MSGLHDETKWAPLTTEFWVALIVSIGIMITAAASSVLDAHGASWIIGMITTGFVVSRGLSKAGSKHRLYHDRD
jgi:hypothetical protein